MCTKTLGDREAEFLNNLSSVTFMLNLIVTIQYPKQNPNPDPKPTDV